MEQTLNLHGAMLVGAALANNILFVKRWRRKGTLCLWMANGRVEPDMGGSKVCHVKMDKISNPTHI